MNDSPFKAIQDAQEIEREGWMPEIPTQLESDAAYAKRCRNACDKLASALSRIDYACGEPNEMECSLYDVDCAEGRVVVAVKAALASKDAEIDRLKKELGEARGALQPFADHYKNDIENIGGETLISPTALVDNGWIKIQAFKDAKKVLTSQRQ